MEYRATSSGTVGTRFYSQGGRAVATRTGNTVNWQAVAEQPVPTGAQNVVVDAYVHLSRAGMTHQHLA